MNNELLGISLRQGKQFNKYQTKIRRNTNRYTRYNIREGFTSQDNNSNGNSNQTDTSQNQRNRISAQLTEKISQLDLDEFQQLEIKYNVLMFQYVQTQKKISNKMLSNVNRIGSNNPYLNKTIKFTTGHIGYVTNKGVVKLIPSTEIWDSVNASKEYVDVNIPWENSYSTKGTEIPTNPPLISGTEVKKGQALGNEGDNIYVNKYLPNDITPSYMGCFSASENNDNMTFIGDKPSSTSSSVENSNFETPILSNNTFKYIKSNSEVPSWTFNGAVLLNNSSAWGYPIPYPSGDQCVSIQNTASISQLINLSSNLSYTLQFMSCGRNCCNSPAKANTIKVELYDINDKLLSSIIEVTPPIDTWTSYSASLNVSTTNNYQLKFSGTVTSGDVSSAIQNISLNSGSSSGFSGEGSYTYDDCKNAAIENGYQYFALQHINTNTSKGFCAVSNSSPAITKYGEASIPTKWISLWSSNTSTQQPGNTASLTNTGSLGVADPSGKIIYATPSYTSSDTGYLGCYADQSSRAMPNTSNGEYYSLDKCRDLAKEKGYKYYAGQNAYKDSTGNYVAWCAGSNDLTSATKYGLATNCIDANGTMLGGGWSNSIYSMESEGNFYLILKDDGNMCVHRGTDPNNDQGMIWCSDTTGKQQSANPDMEASKGKYGKNWLGTGSVLVMGDFISSTKGDLVLTMQDDGNLVLYTFEMETNCKKMNDGNMGGGINANAAYDIQKTAIPKNMGLLAFIDSDSNLKQYPESMMGFANDYQIYKNTNSPGNDLTSLTVTDESSCQKACNDNSECAGYVHDPATSMCWLKNRNEFKKETYDGTTLGIRKPALNNHKSCSKKIIDIDTIQYGNYLMGSEMTETTECSVSLIPQEDKETLFAIQNELLKLGENITAKMEEFYNQNKSVNEQLNMDSEQFKKNLEKYKSINKRLSEEINTEGNNVEGMRSMSSQNMSDINGMLTDSDLIVLQENYSYMLWSILAVGLLAITVNTINK